ncbi:M23 family metallopeptidase [Nafulsella turpanensis]|uniref:M23 family metallopeptidase n=1 Tax=Nafulsella turpanensis TaxID=1265690 RepID=UPI0009DA8379|nr:M23 family metallopeptidase [Nafulsella turpanensis]
MKRVSNLLIMLLIGASVLTSCDKPDELNPVQPAVEDEQFSQLVSDDVTGVSLSIPSDWHVKPDPVLFEKKYGFFLYAINTEQEVAESGHPEDPIAHVSMHYKAELNQLEALVNEKMQQYRDFNPTKKEILLGNGHKGVVIAGLPGTKPYSVVFTASGKNIYELGFWSETAGLDERADIILENIRLETPARSVASLELRPAAEALFKTPPAEVKVRNEIAVAERKALAMRAVEAGELRVGPYEVREKPELARQNSCGFTAPSTLYWQLQWDGTNTFYSGSWYSMRNKPGWSAMSGNYGSWWGENYHVGLCYTDRLNQYYTNDWPIYYWENAYAAFSGYVEWAAWGTDGFASLGRYVVVRNGKYRSLTAHLSGINVSSGQWIDAYWDVIGWGGDTGEYYANADWAPHLHAGVNWGASLTYNGQPYGGQSVKPRRLRCFSCNNYDVAASSGSGGYYNEFWHGRWMKY